MPLLKRKPFPSAKLPKDLEPHELVYQVRFTKEIFRNYDEYLNRVNIYRQRLWMCEVTGKSNLTYEEALVSEKLATEKVQQFPKELTAPALRIIQYSMLSLKDLSDALAEKLQERLVVGTELCGRRDNKICPCKIVKILEEGKGKVRYEVAWLDKCKKVVANEIVNADVLIQKKFPLSRNVLKSFIRRSTYRSGPWVVHDKLAQDHGISTTLPQELRSKAFFRDGLLFCSKKRKTSADTNGNNDKEDNQLGTVKYPMDDLLVQPSIDDPVFTDRPSPTREFNIPMDTVGDLLMVWDFCSSFGRLLNLYPFSLEDFENAICHKDSSSSLLVESHSSFFRLLMKDGSDYFLFVQKRKRKFKITLLNWTDYLCDFLEFIDIPEFRANTATIKRGHYYLLDAHAKLSILKELVNQAIQTVTLKEKLDEFIEQRQLLGATRRGEALEEGRLKREKKEWLKSQSISQRAVNYRTDLISADSNGGVAVNYSNEEVTSSSKDFSSLKRDKKHFDTESEKVGAKIDVGAKILANGKDSVKEESRDHNMEATGRHSKEQRKEYYEREMEKRFVRTNPLGKDRDYNRYWWFRRDGRIFVESLDSKQWGYYISVEELDALKSTLNCKGERERALQMQLEKFYSRICTKINKRSKETNHLISSEEAILRRSTRVRASPKQNPSTAFLRYINKWKVD